MMTIYSIVLICFVAVNSDSLLLIDDIFMILNNFILNTFLTRNLLFKHISHIKLSDQISEDKENSNFKNYFFVTSRNYRYPCSFPCSTSGMFYADFIIFCIAATPKN